MSKIKNTIVLLSAIAAFAVPVHAQDDAEEADAEKISVRSSEFLRDAVIETRLRNLDADGYSAAVESLFGAYEKELGAKISRGEKGKVGIKVYTNSGPGMCTPRELVDAVIEQLGARGYKREDITIVDMSRRRLRECGFLPKLSQLREGKSDTYDGVNVVDVDGGKYFSKQWFYDNPLTPKNTRGGKIIKNIYDPELRKSYLPVPLFLTVDFWINLPVITDMEGLGVCACLGNSSIWNMSNNERFLKQPANASMAAAEVCAIPELRDSQIFSILTFGRGQFVGGAIFNARCSFSERSIMLSANPVVLDYIAWETINKYRRSFGFPIIETMPALLNYCRELKVGDWDVRKIRKIVAAPQKANR